MFDWIGPLLVAGLGVLFLARRWSRKPTPPERVSADPGPRPMEARVAPQNYLARWRVSYLDADGVITERVIRVTKVQPKLEKLQVWCELRKDRRTFNMAGLRTINDAKTGAVVDFAAWLDVQAEARKAARAAANQG